MGTKILLADELRMVREGIRWIVSEHEGFEVVAEAGDGQEAVRLCAELEPDVAVIELMLPTLSGLVVIERLRQESPRTRVIVLSARLGRGWVEEAIRAGAAGYVPKSSGGDDLIHAIDATVAGDFYISPGVTKYVVEAVTNPERGTGSRLSVLTKREREVLQLIAEGLSSREIAATLGVSPKTADSHRAGVMQKTGIRKSASLVRLAIREGLVAP